MNDPIGALQNILSGARTLPNGGGDYSVANSTSNGFNMTPVDMSLPTSYSRPTLLRPNLAPTNTQTQDGTQSGYQGGPSAGRPTYADNVMTGTSSVGMTPEEKMKLQSIADKYKTQQPSSNDLYDQWLKERETGTGLYALPKDVSLTPDQIFGLRSMADDHYATVLQAATAREKAAANNPAPIDFSSDPQVNALVSTGLISGGTAAERAANAQRIMALPEDQKKAAINTIAYQNLGPTQKENYTSNEQASQLGQYALTLLDPDMVNNPYKYTANNYITYLGGTKDPRYTNFMQNVQSVIAPIRKSFFGASLTEGEQKSANQFLPDPSTDDIKTLAMKLRNVNAVAQFTNDVMISNILGTPRPKIADYITVNADGSPKQNNTNGFAESWD